ncbi:MULTISPECIES: hypothetical protein [Microcoleaceae]|nr:hypothetical protein [Tychonema sp. LEGE 06208]
MQQGREILAIATDLRSVARSKSPDYLQPVACCQSRYPIVTNC